MKGFWENFCGSFAGSFGWLLGVVVILMFFHDDIAKAIVDIKMAVLS